MPSQPRTTSFRWCAILGVALLACSGTTPGMQASDQRDASSGAVAVQCVGLPARVGASPPEGTSLPGSTNWEIALDYDGVRASGMAPVWADDGGNVYTLAVTAGKITAEKHDRSAATLWHMAVEPACSQGFWSLGATPDGRLAVEVTYCPLGFAYRPTASRVTLLDPSGGVVSEFTTGWGHALAINPFGEVYTVSADLGSPVVASPTGDRLISGSPVLLRLIRPDGTEAWVNRDGSLLPMAYSLQPLSDGGAMALTPDGTAAFRIDRSGTPLWTSELPVTAKFSVFPFTAALRDGSFVVAVETSGVVACGSGQAGAAGQNGRALLIIGCDGRPRTIVPLPSSAPGEPRNIAPTSLADGGVAVWEPLAACGRIWAFSSDLSLRWERQLDESCTTSIASAVGARDGPVFAVERWHAGTERLATEVPYLLSLHP